MGNTSSVSTKAPANRADILAAAKLKSTFNPRTAARVTLDDETFVYEAGRLVEYEYTLPPEYLEYPDKDS